jgi:hypothetical protein
MQGGSVKHLKCSLRALNPTTHCYLKNFYL